MRRQLPAYSPISLSALLSGLSGALGSAEESGAVSLIQSQVGALSVLLTDSGTSALTLALAAVDAGPQPLIALPAYACYDLATAADGANARVLFYDVDPQTLAPEPASFTRVLARNPHAVVLVHLYGVPVDVFGLVNQVELSGALLVEDAAQAIGASVAGKKAGSLGSLAVLSFGRGKGLSAGGGGALLANDEAGRALLHRIRARVRPARAGWLELSKAAAQWLLGRPQAFGMVAALPFLRVGETLYHSPRTPASLSLSSAKMISRIWAAAQAQADVRRANASRLLRAVGKSSLWKSVHIADAATPGFLRLPLVAERPTDTLDWRRANALGVAPGYPLPLSRLPGFGDRSVNTKDGFPGADRLAAQLVTLPTHSLLTERDLAQLEAWLQNPA